MSRYKNLAKKLCHQTIDRFYIKEKNIFQKNEKKNNDIFFNQKIHFLSKK